MTNSYNSSDHRKEHDAVVKMQINNAYNGNVDNLKKSFNSLINLITQQNTPKPTIEQINTIYNRIKIYAGNAKDLSAALNEAPSNSVSEIIKRADKAYGVLVKIANKK